MCRLTHSNLYTYEFSLFMFVFAAAYRNLGQNLWGPHRYGCLNDVQVSNVVSGPCAAHSLLITTEGKLWSWGMCPYISCHFYLALTELPVHAFRKQKLYY